VTRFVIYVDLNIIDRRVTTCGSRSKKLGRTISLTN